MNEKVVLRPCSHGSPIIEDALKTSPLLKAALKADSLSKRVGQPSDHFFSSMVDTAQEFETIAEAFRNGGKDRVQSV